MLELSNAQIICHVKCYGLASHKLNSLSLPVAINCTETLDWAGNTDPSFKARWWRECEVLREGDWGRVVRLFYHIFYGEGFVVHPGCKLQREADKKPFAGKNQTT